MCGGGFVDQQSYLGGEAHANDIGSTQAITVEGTLSEDEPYSNRLAVLMHSLDLEEKIRRRAESECDNLRCMGKLFAPNQMGMMEKGTTRGSTW